MYAHCARMYVLHTYHCKLTVIPGVMLFALYKKNKYVDLAACLWCVVYTFSALFMHVYMCVTPWGIAFMYV